MFDVKLKWDPRRRERFSRHFIRRRAGFCLQNIPRLRSSTRDRPVARISAEDYRRFPSKLACSGGRAIGSPYLDQVLGAPDPGIVLTLTEFAAQGCRITAAAKGFWPPRWGGARRCPDHG